MDTEAQRRSGKLQSPRSSPVRAMSGKECQDGTNNAEKSVQRSVHEALGSTPALPKTPDESKAVLPGDFCPGPQGHCACLGGRARSLPMPQFLSSALLMVSYKRALKEAPHACLLTCQPCHVVPKLTALPLPRLKKSGSGREGGHGRGMTRGEARLTQELWF